MKRILSIALLAITLLAVAPNANAQMKFGYLDSQEILYSMPEATQMDQALMTKQQELEGVLEQMYNDYYEKLDDYQQNGEQWMEAIREVKLQELADAQKNITDFEYKAQQQLVNLQEQYLVPIIEKARKAIDEVAEAKGLTYVFDLSSEAIVHAPEEDDITDAVKTKLGIQ